jgi:CelD/BcsL family acetyltransferase involved in cellulose biosynthesis
VGRIDPTHVPAAAQPAGGEFHGPEGSWTVDPRGGYEAWLAGRKRAGTDPARKPRARLKRVAEAHGPVTFASFSQDPALLDVMLAWKRDQFRATGQPDLLDWPWEEQVVRATIARPDPAFEGRITAVLAGGRPVAAILALRSHARLHTWFPAYDPEFAAFSVGNLALLETLRTAAEEGITEVDFGPGSYAQKASFADGQRTIQQGFFGRSGVACAVRAGADRPTARRWPKTVANPREPWRQTRPRATWITRWAPGEKDHGLSQSQLPTSGLGRRDDEPHASRRNATTRPRPPPAPAQETAPRGPPCHRRTRR